MRQSRKTVHPKTHATARSNSLFRLVGTIYFRGIYHVFFEAFPFGPQRSDRRFVGHASSEDLVQWKEEGYAVYPTVIEDSGGAREGSASADEDGNITLYYVGTRILESSPDDLNRTVEGSRIETSIMCVKSHREGNLDIFDNVSDKRILLRDSELEGLGLASGSVKDPAIYTKDGERYLTFIAKDLKGKTLLAFAREREGNFEIYSKKPFDGDYEISTCSFLRVGEKIVVLIEKDTDRPEILIGFGDLDLDRGDFQIDERSLKPVDHGYDSTSPKISWDTRGIPYLTCSLQMNHSIRGLYGMVGLPRRITLDKEGAIELTLHPLISRRMIYPETEIKIRQTHFPQMLKATLSEGSFISVGNTAIYFHENILYVDRRKSLFPEEAFRDVKTATIPIQGNQAMIQVVIDQDCLEVFCQGRTLSFIICDADPIINIGEGVKDVALTVLSKIKN